MSTEHTVEKTTASIVSALSHHELSNEEKEHIKAIISTSLANAVETTSDENLSTAVICCGPEADLAHKIRHEVNLKKKALVANLLGLR